MRELDESESPALGRARDFDCDAAAKRVKQGVYVLATIIAVAIYVVALTAIMVTP